ncbi:hypothetical protein mO075L [Vaccinia virus]|uniref:Uncharacterized protein n=2 Tax=Vaccinia virus TaxID=10245 RepID=Q49PS3_VACC0|nr:hypothetical protein m8075L [Vaccinia virus]AAW23750.1 hypothetical protein mO075L [Vaccinia virus]BBD06126.1 putative E ORF C [BAC cloning vector pLC16m8.8S-BAC]
MLHEFHVRRLLKFRVESCSSIHSLSLHPLYVIMSPMDIISFNSTSDTGIRYCSYMCLIIICCVSGELFSA